MAHEVVHGIWHVDKGILYTLQKVLTRPGKLARAYVSGKRAGHFSLVTLLVLLVSILLFVWSHRFHEPINLSYAGKPLPGFVALIAKGAKWALLIMVPVMAKASSDIFKMLRYNFTEHIVMNGFFYAGMLCITLAFSALYYIPGVYTPYVLIPNILAVIAYIVVAYRQATRDLYIPSEFIKLVTLFIPAVIGYIMFVLWISVTIYTLVEKLL
jgi:hypothetical protein